VAVTQANTDAFDVIGKRWTETLDEIGEYAKQHPAA
jgi:hypothetical protein